jgi:polysaccharide export outer membrane protein
LLVAAAALLLAAFAGCTTSERELIAIARALQDARMSGLDPTGGAYVVKPPDVIRVFFQRNPELNVDAATVRPDGRIQFPYVGDAKVAGLTCQEIRSMLAALYLDRYRINEDEITVSLLSTRSRAVYILGEVRYPGPVLYDHGITLVEALSRVGGMLRFSDWTNICVVRASFDEPKVYKVNWYRVLDGDPAQDMLLEPEDIVYVWPTAVARFGYWLDEMLFPFTNLVRGVDQSSSTVFNFKNFGEFP